MKGSQLAKIASLCFIALYNSFPELLSLGISQTNCQLTNSGGSNEHSATLEVPAFNFGTLKMHEN